MSNEIQINFRPSEKQFKAWNYLRDNDTLFVGYGGAAFSGKSYLLCYWLTTMSIAYPDTAWGLGRKELVTLKKTTLITLFKVFEECNILVDKHYTYNQQLNYIEFYNKSRIYLVDMAYKPSDPLFTRFGGLELTGAAIDESAENEYDAIKILFTRLGRKNNSIYGLKKKLLETFNPAKNHVYSRYYQPHKQNQETKETKFIPALPKDNPSPDVEDYVNDIIKTGDTVTIERLIYGNFEYDDNPYAMFDYSDILGLFTNDHVLPKQDKYMTCDIAYTGSDKFVITIWHGFVAVKIIAIDKIDDTMISKKIGELQSEYKVPWKNIIFDADGLQKFTRHSAEKGILARAIQFHNGGTPIKIAGKKEMFKNLKAQCYYYFAEYCKNAEIKIIEKDYRNQIIQELEQINRLPLDDEGKFALEKKDKIRERIGRSPDFADSLMMRFFFELKGKAKPVIIWN
jgi:hypothetical protein